MSMIKTSRLFLAVLCLLLLNCEKAKIPLEMGSGAVYSYPFQPDNHWQYDYQLLLYSQDSLIANLTYSVAVTYLGLDSPVAGGEILHHLQSSLTEQDKSFQSDVWYRQDERGLWEIAYRVSGGPLALPKADRTAAATKRLLQFWLQPESQSLQADSVYFREMPRLVLSYPFFYGKSWTEFVTPWRQTDTILDQRDVTTPLGNVLCWRIRRKGDFFANSNTTFLDYYSDFGLIKRVYESDMDLTDPDNPDGVGTGHVIETLVLREFPSPSFCLRKARKSQTLPVKIFQPAHRRLLLK